MDIDYLSLYSKPKRLTITSRSSAITPDSGPMPATRCG